MEYFFLTSSLMLGVASGIAGAVVGAVQDVSHALRRAFFSERRPTSFSLFEPL
jgi:hypothetical protein